MGYTSRLPISGLGRRKITKGRLAYEVVWTCKASLPFRCLYLLGGYRSVPEIIFTLELSCDQLCEALVT